MQKGTQSELVKELGCSRTAISKLVKAKDYRIIYINGGKRINIEASLKALIDSGFGKRSNPIKKKTTVPKTVKKTPTTEEMESDLEFGGPLKVTDGRARIEIHKAFHQSEKERINNEIKLEKLIDVDDVSEESFNVWRPFRDDLQSLPDRLVKKIRSAESDHEAEQHARTEVNKVLNSVIENFEDLDDESQKKKITGRLLGQITGH